MKELLTACVTVADTDIDESMLGIVVDAVEERRFITFTYRRGTETTQRTIEPVTILHMWSQWYVFGWDHSRHDWRIFRMDRIHLIDVSRKRFSKKRKGSGNPFEKLRLDYYHSRALIIVIDIEGDVGEGLRMISLVNGSVTRRGKNTVRVELAADSFDEVTSVMLAGNFECNILKPDIYRKYVAALGKRLLHAAR